MTTLPSPGDRVRIVQTAYFSHPDGAWSVGSYGTVLRQSSAKDGTPRIRVQCDGKYAEFYPDGLSFYPWEIETVET